MTLNRQDTTQEFENLLEQISQLRGFDFGAYKRATLMRRIRKRMDAIKVETFDEYLARLEADPDEFTQLFNTVLINVTGFFRDPEAWDYLAREIVPAVLRSKEATQPIRVWSAACASGEEAYSAAMVFAEQMGIEQFRERVKIYATDLDEEALAQARHGGYAARSVNDIPEKLREKYFQPGPDGYLFRKDLRRSLIFGRHDLLNDAPISRVDLLICRNTLMYFNSDSQRQILERLHFALNDRAYLFLGKAEMLLTNSHLFAPKDLKWRVFHKISRSDVRDRIYMLGQSMDGNREAQALTEYVFELDPVAQVVVSADGTVALINQRARELFRLGHADLGRPFQDLELSYRPTDLRSAMDRARSNGSRQDIADVRLVSPAGDVLWFNVQIQPLADANAGVVGATIAFIETTDLVQLQEGYEETQHELETAGEELQSTNEELETTNEELQSTIEELETTNEELQSTNEELETMNEELQATNEELQTVNDELRVRTDESNRTNIFLESILRSIRVAAIVIDEDENIQVWNRYAEELWGPRSEEVIGRRFYSVEIGIPVEALRGAVTSCLQKGSRFEEIELDGHNRVGKPVRVRVSAVPLTSLLDVEKDTVGVILLMEEVHPAVQSGAG